MGLNILLCIVHGPDKIPIDSIPPKLNEVLKAHLVAKGGTAFIRHGTEDIGNPPSVAVCGFVNADEVVTNLRKKGLIVAVIEDALPPIPQNVRKKWYDDDVIFLDGTSYMAGINKLGIPEG